MLPRTGFLAQASPELTETLERLAQTVTLDTGETLFEQGDTGAALYAVTHGALEISVLSEDGRKFALDVMRDGAVLGEIALFDPGPRTATVTATEPTELLRIRNGDLLREIRVAPELGIDMIALAGQRMRWMNRQITEQVFLPMQTRLARKVLYLTDKSDPATDLLSLSQSELADFVGATREAVSKALSEWKKMGTVSSSRRGIQILDRAALQALADLDQI